MIWATLIMFVVSFVLTALLTPKPELENARPQSLDDINFPRATENAPVPMVLGKVTMRAPNVIWYGNFRVVPIREKIKTGLFSSTTITVGHRYFVTLDLALCIGPKIVMSEIFIDDESVWSGTVNDTIPTTIVTTRKDLFGGYKNGGGWDTTNTYYPGSQNLTDQPVDPTIENLVGVGNVPAYLGISHIVMDGEIGESAQIRKISFTLESYTNELGGIPNNAKIGVDINPAEAIYQILTNEWIGIGINPSLLDLDSLRSLGQTCYDEGNGVSIQVTAETSGTKVIQEILRQIDGVAYQDPETGKITFKLIRDDYDENTIPVFDSSDIVAVKNFSKSGWNEVTSQVKITFPQRDSSSQKVAIAQDMAISNMLNRLKSTTISMPFCYDKDLANRLAQRELSHLSVPLFRMTIEMNRNAYALRPGDVIKISWPEYGFDEIIMRIQEFDLGSLLDGKIVVKCIQDKFAISSVVMSSPENTGWTAPQYDPVDITESRIIEMPRFYQKKVQNTIEDGKAGIAVSAKKPSNTSTGYDVLSGISSGQNNTLDPEYAEFNATGTLVNQYDKDAGFFTGVDSTGFTLENVSGEFEPANDATQLRNGETGILVINDEWIGFTSFTDNMDGTVTIGEVHRGLFGTTPQTHSVGDRVWQLKPIHFGKGELDLDATGTAFVKMLDKVASVTQDPNDVAEQSKTMQDLANRPLRPRNLELDGSRNFITVNTTDLDATWVPSNREKTDISFETDPAETPDQTETYDLKVMVNGVEEPALSQNGVSSPHTIPFSSTNINSSDCEIRVWSRRTSGDLKSSAFYAFFQFELNQNYTIGNSNHYDTYDGLNTTNIVSMYSLRKRISTYSGPLIRIRDTDDDSEQDVGFDANGELASFTVVGEARVVKWYDQSAAGLDLTQTVKSEQPLLDITGSPNGSPCIDFSGGNRVLLGPVFSDGSPNAHKIDRPTWMLCAVGDTGTSFRYACFLPHNKNVHVSPYYRMGMIWEPDEGIETRFNGTIVPWGGSAISNITGDAMLWQDFHSDVTKMKTYVNSKTIDNELIISGNYTTAGNDTQVRIGSNPSGGEIWNGKIMEFLIGDFGLTSGMSKGFYEEMTLEWYADQLDLSISNPGAEQDMAGWTNNGMYARDSSSNPPARTGSKYFAGGAQNLVDAYQDIEVQPAIHDKVDAGSALVNISWFQRSLAGSDKGNIKLEFFDDSMTSLGTDPGPGLVAASSSAWDSRTTGDVSVPVNTRTIRITMEGQRVTGSNCDSYFDDISGIIK